MDTVTVITSVLSLIAGVGIFLIACSMLSSNLEAIGSKKLKSLFSKTSKSKLAGVGIGAATTAIIQSSSATSVMVIGFVNAGIMTLAQAATVIFGANIGTTITGQLVALGMFGGGSVSTSAIFGAFAGIGAFILTFAKNDRLQKLGGIIAGFGMLFVGLSMMSGAMEHFAELQSIKNFLAMFKNPFLLVLIGAVLCAVVQSSTVLTTMAITMVVAKLIVLDQGIYLVMGANLGTCATTLIAGFTSTKSAKQTALLHLVFNISGVALFLLIGLLMRVFGSDYGRIFEAVFPHTPQVQLAMFHTVFNIATTFLVLPFTDLLVKLVKKILPERGETPNENEPRFFFVEKYMLKNPPIAVQQTKREIVNMAHIALRNFELSTRIVCTLDYEEIETFRANEKQLDFLNDELSKFIVKLLEAHLSEKDRVYLSTAFRSLIDLERIGDYAENIIEYADKLKEANQAFSEEAQKEIKELQELIRNLFDSAVTAYRKKDKQALKKAYEIEETVDAFTSKMAENYVKRLSEGKCTPEEGAQYLSLSTSAERIADHYINVAKTIKPYA